MKRDLSGAGEYDRLSVTGVSRRPEYFDLDSHEDTTGAAAKEEGAGMEETAVRSPWCKSCAALIPEPRPDVLGRLRR